VDAGARPGGGGLPCAGRTPGREAVPEMRFNAGFSGLAERWGDTALLGEVDRLLDALSCAQLPVAAGGGTAWKGVACEGPAPSELRFGLKRNN
jgi:hypothetical protein